MGVVTRPDSRWYWLNLERPGQRVIREATRILVDGGTPEQTKANRALAQAAYSVRMGDLARQRYDLPVERPRTTFKAYRAIYLRDISAHKRNEVREASMLRKLGETFDPLDLSDIDLDAGRAWRTARSKQITMRDTPVAPSTVNREMEILKHLMGTAVPKYLDANPLSGLQPLRVPERETRILEPEEETRLLAVLDVAMTAVVLTALDTLQRLSSVADIRRAQDHVSYITFLNTKTRGGKVPISKRLRAALDAHIEALPAKGAYLFPELQVGTVGARRSLVIRQFGAACESAAIQGFTFHGLRHTGASRMLAANVDIETVRRIGGWANYTVLKRYLHPKDQATRDAVETIDGTRAIHATTRRPLESAT